MSDLSKLTKILLVDDDPDLILVLSQVIEAEGYQVFSVSDGDQAIKKCESIRPQLVILDVALPKMDGWKVCQKIKENPHTKDIPILIITGKIEAVNELMSYESGADAYLSKPFNNQDLLNSIQELVKAKSSL